MRWEPVCVEVSNPKEHVESGALVHAEYEKKRPQADPIGLIPGQSENDHDCDQDRRFVIEARFKRMSKVSPARASRLTGDLAWARHEAGVIAEFQPAPDEHRVKESGERAGGRLVISDVVQAQKPNAHQDSRAEHTPAKGVLRQTVQIQDNAGREPPDKGTK